MSLRFASVIGLDPGPESSAIVGFNGTDILLAGEYRNPELIRVLEDLRLNAGGMLAIEHVQSFGMPVGREVFDTVFWAGRFAQAWGPNHSLVGRKTIKVHLCHAANAKDANVRAALFDRFGPGKARAVGSKGLRGPLYGIKSHQLSALAVAITWFESQDGPASPLKG